MRFDNQNGEWIIVTRQGDRLSATGNLTIEADAAYVLGGEDGDEVYLWVPTCEIVSIEQK